MPVLEHPPEKVDIAICGAGPAGLTLAALLKKYRPETSVVVLEKKTFPRHKIGESLIIDINRVLADMGCVEAVDQAGFVPKYGSTFVWGSDRTPRSFMWPEWDEAGYLLPYTWHVERPRYDQILADCALEHGADICFEQTVLAPEMDGERVTGLQLRGKDGEERTITAKWTIDCGGFGGPLTRKLAGHQLDTQLRNIAVWGYHKNIGWTEELNGTAQKSRALLMSHDTGWIWVLPVSQELTSVGFVTNLEGFQEEGVEDIHAWYEDKLDTLPEHDMLFADAELVDYRQDGKMVHSVQEFGYSCDRLWGPGWVLNGDSAGFVDAILSIGCFMAQHHAQFLSYALASMLDGELDDALALNSYERTCKENLEAFRSIAHMLYAFNSTGTDWWRSCSSVLKESMLVPGDADPGAFVAFFTGFSTRNALYDEAVASFGGHFLTDFSSQLFNTESLFAKDQLDARLSDSKALLRGNPRLRVVGNYKTEAFALPKVGEGRLRPVTRVDVELAEDDASQPLARRMYVPAALARVVELLDGTRTLRQVAAEWRAGGVAIDPRQAEREVTKVAYRLACMGALERVDAPLAATA